MQYSVKRNQVKINTNKKTAILQHVGELQFFNFGPLKSQGLYARQRVSVDFAIQVEGIHIGHAREVVEHRH